jgi:hypothetical protein
VVNGGQWGIENAKDGQIQAQKKTDRHGQSVSIQSVVSSGDAPCQIKAQGIVTVAILTSASTKPEL